MTELENHLLMELLKLQYRVELLEGIPKEIAKENTTCTALNIALQSANRSSLNATPEEYSRWSKLVHQVIDEAFPKTTD